MTLDETIMHEEEFVEGFERGKRIKAVTLEEYICAEEHRRLAEWLKELKQYKEYDMGKQAPVNDCVSRISVQEEITKSIELKENPHQLWQRIQALSPVQPEQKTGRWIKTGECNYTCSECGQDANVNDLNYCPECGKKMEVDNE